MHSRSVFELTYDASYNTRNVNMGHQPQWLYRCGKFRGSLSDYNISVDKVAQKQKLISNFGLGSTEAIGSGTMTIAGTTTSYDITVSATDTSPIATPLMPLLQRISKHQPLALMMALTLVVESANVGGGALRFLSPTTILLIAVISRVCNGETYSADMTLVNSAQDAKCHWLGHQSDIINQHLW